MPLLNILENDCRQWAGQGVKTLLLNERDMQVRLTMYLEKTHHYDKVYTEYAVPLEMLRNLNFVVPQSLGHNQWTKPVDFPWHNEMSIDIVVEKDGKFAAVELKYATVEIANPVKVFGLNPPKGKEIIKSQGASNIVMYRYWKDVRRIEALTHFPQVEGGVALIIGNERICWQKAAQVSGYTPFTTEEGHKVGPGVLQWGPSIGQTNRGKYPAFKLDKSYTCKWADTSIPDTAKNGDKFRYMINVIK